jgi:hypothetical protein
MTVFYCAKCATALTPELAGLPDVPVLEDGDTREKKTGRARSTVPRGFYAVDPEPWGAPFVPAAAPPIPRRGTGRDLLRPSPGRPTVSAGPRNTIIVHPDDVPDLVPFVDGDNQARGST